MSKLITTCCSICLPFTYWLPLAFRRWGLWRTTFCEQAGQTRADTGVKLVLQSGESDFRPFIRSNEPPDQKIKHAAEGQRYGRRREDDNIVRHAEIWGREVEQQRRGPKVRRRLVTTQDGDNCAGYIKASVCIGRIFCIPQNGLLEVICQEHCGPGRNTKLHFELCTSLPIEGRPVEDVLDDILLFAAGRVHNPGLQSVQVDSHEPWKRLHVDEFNILRVAGIREDSLDASTFLTVPGETALGVQWGNIWLNIFLGINLSILAFSLDRRQDEIDCGLWARAIATPRLVAVSELVDALGDPDGSTVWHFQAHRGHLGISQGACTLNGLAKYSRNRPVLTYAVLHGETSVV